jgi:hypothetical protein
MCAPTFVRLVPTPWREGYSRQSIGHERRRHCTKALRQARVPLVGRTRNPTSRVPTKYLDKICSEGMSDNNNQNNKLGQKLTLVDIRVKG